MKKISSAFTEHPASVGENYLQHMGTAFSFALPLLASGVACLIHGFFPFLFVKTGSKVITRLHDRMVMHRSRLTQQTESCLDAHLKL